MCKVNLQRFFEDCQNSLHTDNYTDSYPSLITHFKAYQVMDKDSFVACVHIVYGWMPTIVTIHQDKSSLQDAVETVNRIKNTKVMGTSDMDILANVINHSHVGASKLLHFMLPDTFPIWDSKIYKYLNGGTLRYHGVHNSKNYMLYMDIIKRIISDERFESVRHRFQHMFGYEITDIRLVELIMFQNSP